MNTSIILAILVLGTNMSILGPKYARRSSIEVRAAERLLVKETDPKPADLQKEGEGKKKYPDFSTPKLVRGKKVYPP